MSKRYEVRQSPDRLDVFDVYDTIKECAIAGYQNQLMAIDVCSDWNFEESIKSIWRLSDQMETLAAACK